MRHKNIINGIDILTIAVYQKSSCFWYELIIPANQVPGRATRAAAGRLCTTWAPLEG
jgi:hypothetical protein